MKSRTNWDLDQINKKSDQPGLIKFRKTPGPNNFLRLRLFWKPNELRIDRYCLNSISRKSLFVDIARSHPNIVFSFFEKGFSRVISRHLLPGTRRLVNVIRSNIGRGRNVKIRKPYLTFSDPKINVHQRYERFIKSISRRYTMRDKDTMRDFSRNSGRHILYSYAFIDHCQLLLQQL